MTAETDAGAATPTQGGYGSPGDVADRAADAAAAVAGPLAPAPKKPEASDSVVPNYIDVERARRTRAVHFPGVLSDADLEEVFKYHRLALDSGDPLETNPQNRQHHRKRCVFLHGAAAPEGGLVQHAPRVLAKLLRAAVEAKERGGWGGGAGPLADIDVRRLSLRVVELWEYEPGGGLVDDLHYDAGSIVTVVCLVCDRGDFTGGAFRTFEASGEQLEHPLEKGDVLCLLSHKYHNITPVESGMRKTLVIELWQGGLAGWCR